MSLLRELQRRNVIRVATAYVVTAWLVIQVIETIFPAFGFGDGAVRVAVIVLGIGFIPAVIGAWVFEWTPEGFRRDSEVIVSSPAARTRRFDAAIIATLALAVVYFAIDKFVIDPVRDEDEIEAAAAEAVEGIEFEEAEVECVLIYEVEGEANGKEYEIEITADGQVIEIEEEEDDD